MTEQFCEVLKRVIFLKFEWQRPKYPSLFLFKVPARAMKHTSLAVLPFTGSFLISR